MIGSSFLGYSDVSSGMRDMRTTVPNVWFFMWEMDRTTARIASDSRSDSLFTSPAITQGHQGMVKDTGKAGSDGQPASQRGGNVLKFIEGKSRG